MSEDTRNAVPFDDPDEEQRASGHAGTAAALGGPGGAAGDEPRR